MVGKRTTLILGAVCVFQAGWIAGQLLTAPAHAQDPEAATEAAPYLAPGSPPMLCRAFELDKTAPTVDTTDPTTPQGEWVNDREGEGWVMYGVDFEIGQKATGYPSTWAQICLYKP